MTDVEIPNQNLSQANLECKKVIEQQILNATRQQQVIKTESTGLCRKVDDLFKEAVTKMMCQSTLKPRFKIRRSFRLIGSKPMKHNVIWPKKPDYFNPIVIMYADFVCRYTADFTLQNGQQSDEKVTKYEHLKTDLDPTIPYEISILFRDKRVVGIEFNNFRTRVERDYSVEDSLQKNERLVGFCGIKNQYGFFEDFQFIIATLVD